MNMKLTTDPQLIGRAKSLLYEELFVPLQLPDTMQDQLRIAGEEHYFVAVEEHEVVSVMVLVIEGRHAELHHAATRSSYRGRGIGKQLWQLVSAYCAERELRNIELVSRNTAISFWREVGFEESSDAWIERPEFVKHGIRHKAMKQTLVDTRGGLNA
jgi:GNAT superfamily N-acetyltransferase